MLSGLATDGNNGWHKFYIKAQNLQEFTDEVRSYMEKKTYLNTGIKKEQVGRLPILTPIQRDAFYLHIILGHDHSNGKKSLSHNRRPVKIFICLI